MTATSKVRISWDKIVADSRLLAAMCLAKRPQSLKWSAIVAVTRGGLIPAALLAEKMGIRIVDTVCIQSYNTLDQRLAEAIILKDINGGWDTRLGFDDFLVVDDLVDSGETADTIKTHLPGAHFACLYAKPVGERFADTYVEVFDQSQWIVFPWEEL